MDGFLARCVLVLWLWTTTCCASEVAVSNNKVQRLEERVANLTKRLQLLEEKWYAEYSPNWILWQTIFRFYYVICSCKIIVAIYVWSYFAWEGLNIIEANKISQSSFSEL